VRLGYRARHPTFKGAPGPIWRDGVAIYAEVNVQFSLSQVQDQTNVFGLWRVCFPPCLVRPGRRLPVQGLSEGSLGFRDRLPAERGPGTGLKLCHQGYYQKSKRDLVYGIWSQ